MLKQEAMKHIEAEELRVYRSGTYRSATAPRSRAASLQTGWPRRRRRRAWW